MGTAKTCYNCMTGVDEDAKVCPRCKAKLGPMKDSGIAAKPGSPLLLILLAAVPLAAIAVAISVFSRHEEPAGPLITISTGIGNVRDGAIQKIKEKGAGELSNVGVADVGYVDDTLCVYVDQRFSNLSRSQQEKLLGIVAGEWEKAIGKSSTAVKVLEYGTKKTLAELVV